MRPKLCKCKLKLARELRALNRDAASGVTPLVLGENPSPTRTRSKTSTVSGSAERAAIFDVKSRREPPGEMQGSATPLTRSIADLQEVASCRPTPLTRSSPGDETPSVEGVPSATMCSGDDRLNPVTTPQVQECVKGTLPVLPGAHTDTWSNLIGHETSRRVWRDLDEPDDRANDPIYPGLTTPKSELGTQKSLLLYDDDIPWADENDSKEHLSELISHMGQAVSQMRATSELLLDEFKTVSCVLQSSLREADSIRRDEMCAMASSLTAVEANSQEILKSNQLLGIEIRGLSTHIASGLRDLGISRNGEGP